jgi:hypothetical protein
MLTINDLSRNEKLSASRMSKVVGGGMEEAGLATGSVGQAGDVAEKFAQAYDDKIVAIAGFFGSLLGVL